MKIVKLIGGPRDGDRIQVSGTAGIIMVPTLDDLAKDPRSLFGMRPTTDHTIGHAYALQADNTATYLGRKSRHELKAQHGGYEQKPADETPDDIDPADWWKHKEE